MVRLIVGFKVAQRSYSLSLHPLKVCTKLALMDTRTTDVVLIFVSLRSHSHPERSSRKERTGLQRCRGLLQTDQQSFSGRPFLRKQVEKKQGTFIPLPLV